MYWEGVVRGVYPGRFQPIHWGHIHAFKWALERVDELIIVIGSAQESHTITNPFSAGERVIMVKLALKDAGIDLNRVYIIPVPDVLINYIWPTYVAMFVPKFKYGISRNPLVIRLFKDAGYEVLIPPAYKRDRYCSTIIRKLMIEGSDEWRDLVPPSVAMFIDEIKGVERIRDILRSD